MFTEQKDSKKKKNKKKTYITYCWEWVLIQEEINEEREDAMRWPSVIRDIASLTELPHKTPGRIEGFKNFCLF